MSQGYLSTKSGYAVRLNGKFIGTLVDRKFVKVVTASRHMLRQPPSWCLDSQIYDEIIKPAAEEIIINDRESHLQYSSSVENFDRYKGVIDRGHSRQYFLILSRWKIDRLTS